MLFLKDICAQRQLVLMIVLLRALLYSTHSKEGKESVLVVEKDMRAHLAHKIDRIL